GATAGSPVAPASGPVSHGIPRRPFALWNVEETAEVAEAHPAGRSGRNGKRQLWSAAACCRCLIAIACYRFLFPTVYRRFLIQRIIGDS
ncbi:MAG: hypothetical protein ACUVQH_14635, partial [Thermogutta sp.]